MMNHRSFTGQKRSLTRDEFEGICVLYSFDQKFQSLYFTADFEAAAALARPYGEDTPWTVASGSRVVAPVSGPLYREHVVIARSKKLTDSHRVFLVSVYGESDYEVRVPYFEELTREAYQAHRKSVARSSRIMAILLGGFVALVLAGITSGTHAPIAARDALFAISAIVGVIAAVVLDMVFTRRLPQVTHH